MKTQFLFKIGLLITQASLALFSIGNPIVIPEFDRGGQLVFDNLGDYPDYIVFLKESEYARFVRYLRYPDDNSWVTVCAVSAQMMDSIENSHDSFDLNGTLRQKASHHVVRTDARILEANLHPPRFLHDYYGNDFGLIEDVFHIEKLDSSGFTIKPVKAVYYTAFDSPRVRGSTRGEEVLYSDPSRRPDPAHFTPTTPKNKPHSTWPLPLSGFFAVSFVVMLIIRQKRQAHT